MDAVKLPVPEAVREAIAHLGGPPKVAALRGLRTPWAVGKWLRDGVPHNQVLWLAEATSWRWTPHQLRSDLYPHPDDGLPEERRGAVADVVR